MKEILQRLRFAWNVIRHGVPAEFLPPYMERHIIRREYDIHEIVVEYEVDDRVPVHQQDHDALKLLLEELKPYITGETYKHEGGEPKEITRLTLKIAVER